MKSETRKYENIFWSFRKYIKASLPLIRKYYNPQAIPKPTDTDTWIIFDLGISDLDVFTRTVSRIHCVSREDNDESELMGLVSDVVAIFDSPSSGKKYIPFYDKDTATLLGDIWIIGNPKVGPKVPYDTGIISRAIEIHSNVKTDRNSSHA